MTQDAQLRRLGLFDARVPRYTSYPTAPHFTAAVGAPEMGQWIDAIPAGAAISLYLHVPFCRRLCWFCACRTQGTSSDTPVRSYAETLLREIAMLRQRLPKGVRLSRLHWGGGTPTLLHPEDMRRLAGAVQDMAPLAEGGEFSVEIDPNEIDRARLAALVDSGMNRVSIGVQDFDPAIQKLIGREQSHELTRRVVDMVREAGIKSLNADILYGLPEQTGPRIADSVQKLMALGPDRVALYGYAHVPWVSRRQQMIPSDSLPSAEARLHLFETARALLVADGHQEIGIDHFALPSDGLAIAAREGRLKRNFQGYTDDQAEVLVGLGASSISRFPQGYAQNASATATWTRAVREGKLATAKGHAFRGEDHLRGRIIEALMCDFRVDAHELHQRFGTPLEQLQQMFADVATGFEDMLVLRDGILIIPPRARPLTRMVARGFDAWMTAGAQHSAAV